MEELIKPADYARKMGISRQAVYARIKKGLLPSKNIDGKIYIVTNEEPEASSSAAKKDEASAFAEERRNVYDLLSAKEETISILNETIADLKETNRMITSTLRGEVELLKEAFGEMKSLYAAQIEHMSRTDERFAEESIDEAEVESEGEKDEEKTAEWVTLETLFEKWKIVGKKKRRKVLERLKKRYKNGDLRVDRQKGEYTLLTGSGIEEKVFPPAKKKEKR